MSDEKTVAVEASGLTRIFGEGATRVEALSGIDLRVSRGEFVAIMGASGSGKSTLLHLLGGLDEPTSGYVMMDGQDLSSMSDDEITQLRRRHIGFVFQAFNLLHVLTAGENVALPLIIDGRSEAEADKQARAVLGRVGIANRKDHYPTELAGGEQQRVALARSLCADPVLLLADEPTGNLDSRNSEQIITLLRKLVDEHGQTVVMVTHDAGHAAMADRLITLRDGRIEDEQTLPRGRSPDAVLQELEPST
ncbi:MAG: ABC transporter ATP-binding protein [Phycisphaerae bacterium]|nr:ABC transporter ATP-binding protein [Phycisphaerae bacterium]